jgi:U3 small nucleolar RNA-associated protein 25
VDSLLQILGPERTGVANREKFDEEFGPPEEDEEEDDEDSEGSEDEVEAEAGAAGAKKRKRSKRKAKGKPQRPADWEALFSRANVDDDFKLGLQINPGQGKGTGADRGAYLRLFSDFYQSDIIVASPIGLRFIMEKGGEGGGGGGSGRHNIDFLSSLELVVLHQADVMYMQNWEHVEYVLQHTNRLCESDRGTDFSRVRPYFLEGRAAQHRQLLLTTHFNEPAMQACFRAHAASLAGSLRLKRHWGEGCLPLVASRVKQVFQRVPCDSFAAQEEDRFRYFVDQVLSQILRLQQSHTLIVAPSYLSFVRIRNELIHREVSPN